jgi:NAD-dependent dihydropyrimidine dehydrogenase PreA subunit
MGRPTHEPVTWFPTVDGHLCTGDRGCLDSCEYGVFDWDPANDHPVVAHPSRCLSGCRACGRVCPAGAIRFPRSSFLRGALKRLRRAV